MRISNLSSDVCSSDLALQWGGAPSAFLDEDDDARDLLLADVLAGIPISRTRREDADYNDVDGTYIFSLPDGSELPHYIVARLINADVLKPLGWPLSDRKSTRLNSSH